MNGFSILLTHYASKKNPKATSNLSRKYNTEKAIARNLLDGFITKGSRGENLIEQILGTQINKVSLVALIQISRVISELTDIKFPRNYKRKKDLIVKWFSDNGDIIDSYKQYIQIVYSKTSEINN